MNRTKTPGRIGAIDVPNFLLLATPVYVLLPFLRHRPGAPERGRYP
jgi:hypothetical protein